MTSKQQPPGVDQTPRDWLNILIGVLVVSAMICLATGLTLPLLETKVLGVFVSEYSLLDLIRSLLAEGSTFLGLIILTFAVVLPLFKLGLLATVVAAGRRGGLRFRRLVHFIEGVGKWSMADVFVTALAIFALRTEKYANALERPGLYLFAISVFLTMVASQLLRLRHGAGKAKQIP